MSGIMGALLAFQAEAPKLVKSATADMGKFKFKFVPYPRVLEAIQPLLSKHQLVWSTMPCADADGKPVLRYRLLHVPSYAANKAHSSYEIVGVMPLMLASQDSQAHGSALTYAKRQALEAVLNLVAEEDDGGKAASRRRTGDARLLPAESRRAMVAEIEAAGKQLAVVLGAVGLESVEDVTVGHARKIKELLG